MSLNIQVTGIPLARRILSKDKVKIGFAVKKALVKGSSFMQSEVQNSIAGRRAEPTSVDTGNFLRSIQFKISKMSASVFTNVTYAKNLEFGTSKIRPRKHFGNSKKRNQPKVVQIVNAEIKKVI